VVRHLYPLTLSGEPPHRLVGAWLMLAISALGLSALFAVVLVVGRTPYLARMLPSLDGFHSALVLHVTLAAFIWFLAFAAALWNALCTGVRSLRWAGFGLGVAGIVAITVSPLAGEGPAVLSNYLPVLDNTVFLAGLGWFGAGILFTAAGVLAATRLRGRIADGAAALHAGILLALVPTIAAGVSWAWSFATAPEGLHPAAYFEVVSWGAGHALQFTHVLLMMVAWLALAAECGVALPLPPRTVAALFAVAAAPALAAPLVHALYPVATPEFRAAFTALMQYGTWTVAVPLGVLLLVELAKSRHPAVSERGLRATLVISIGLFIAGCVIGAAIRGETTLVPAHYHGTIGAVTLAYMALAARMLKHFGYADQAAGAARWPVLYGAGLALLVMGLAWSGLHGLPRKTGWSAAAGNGEVLAAMAVAGAGGVLAIVAGALFALSAWRAVRGRRRAGRRRDGRLRAFAVTLAAVVCGGIALAWIGDEISRPSAQATAAADPRVDPAGYAAAQRAAEIDRRFQQGVVMLHAKQYDDAIAAFHRVLALAPEMPEAHVNMGFALIGSERHAAARDFFESATSLRANQINAYYGLAVALEGLGDLPGAIGAMRTYTHLSRPEDPYRRKAEAALWEWESAVAEAREPVQSAAGHAPNANQR